MKDLIQLGYEIREKNMKRFEDNEISTGRYTEEFADALLAELAKEKGTDIAPYLSCTYDVMHREYKIVLSLPDSFCHITNFVQEPV